MDMPIYLQFTVTEYDAARPLYGPWYRWCVIEEKGSQETAADDELGEDLLIHKSKQDRVRRQRLPQCNYDIHDAYFAVSNSRLFFFGGRTVRRDHFTVKDNGIFHIDLKQQRSDSDLWARCDKWAEELRYMNGRVLYLICFADFHPMADTKDYRPALYFYNIYSGNWLSKPVQGLPNDGIIFPDTEQHIVKAFLMPVRRDVLKFALVWSVEVERDENDVVSDQTEVHWSKFILRIEGGVNEENNAHAECPSSGAFYGGNTLLINCSTG